jgi:uncharacterized membrane protein YkoI
MKKIALLVAAGAATTGIVATSTATAASSTDAVRAVQTASKGISHKAYELDRERNRWEVTFADGTQKFVSLDGRRVTGSKRDDRSSAAASARVSLATALRTAAPRANGTLTDADLDREGGRLVWTVGFGETEVEVDARTGRVVRVTQDDD